MSLAPELLELLRCPLSGQRLVFASPDLVAKLEGQRIAGTLCLRTAQPQWNPGEPLEAVLVREDGQVGYPVQSGIPILLPDQRIEIIG